MGFYDQAYKNVGQVTNTPLSIASSYLIGKEAIKNAQTEQRRSALLKEGEALQKEGRTLDREISELNKKQEVNSQEIAIQQENVNKYEEGYEKFVGLSQKNELFKPLAEMHKATLDKEQSALNRMNENFQKVQDVLDERNLAKKTWNEAKKYFKERSMQEFGKKWEKKVNKGGWMNDGEK